MQQIDPLGNRTSFAYDATGNQVRTTNPLNNNWTTIYDAGNRAVDRQGQDPAPLGCKNVLRGRASETRRAVQVRVRLCSGKRRRNSGQLPIVCQSPELLHNFSQLERLTNYGNGAQVAEFPAGVSADVYSHEATGSGRCPFLISMYGGRPKTLLLMSWASNRVNRLEQVSFALSSAVLRSSRSARCLPLALPVFGEAS